MSDHVADLAESYVHDLLDGPTAGTVKAHCQSCAVCNQAVEEARNRLARLQAVPREQASPHLIQTALRRIATATRRRRWTVRAGWAAVGSVAAAALVLLGLNLYVQGVEATPYDLVVLGQRELLASTNGSMRVQLIDRKTNTALAGVPVKVELLDRIGGQIIQLASFTTDAQGGGQPPFRVPDVPGDYTLRVTAQTPWAPEILEEKVRVVRSWKIMLSSDKPVYQPGQTIHVRALALRTLDLKPAGEQVAVFTIADPRNNVIYKDDGKTSRFGIASTDCILASEILEGEYVISCKVGDTQTRQSIDVKKYVLPKFKVDVAFDRPFYQPGDRVKATVQANYFFGKPVANATVEIHLGERKRNGIEHTNEQGVYTLEYEIPKEAVEGDASLTLEFAFQVTDVAGQKVTQKAERRVTRSAVRLDVIPENGRIVGNVANKVYVLTTTADGRPLSARIAVSTDTGEIHTTTNDLGAGVFEFRPSRTGGPETVRALVPKNVGVRLALGAGFDAGRGLDGEGTILARKRVDLSAGYDSNEFLLRTDKPVYSAGDMLEVEVWGGSQPVYVDLIKEGQTILSDTILTTSGAGGCGLQLPLDLSGTLELCCYRFDGAKPMQKSRVVYVRAPNDIQITTTIDDQPYRPGQRAKLNFRLTDGKGGPVQGALSLAAVDEAVFAVMRQRPGMERNFYSVNPELLEPVHKLASWSPPAANGVEASDTELRDQALFAATTRAESFVSEAGNQWRSPSAESRPMDRYHSLNDATRPARVAEIEAVRNQRGQWLRRGWLGLILVSLLLAYSALWLYCPRSQVLKGHFVLAVFLLPLACIMGGGLNLLGIGNGPNNTFSYIGQRVGSAGGGSAVGSKMLPVDSSLSTLSSGESWKRETVFQAIRLPQPGQAERVRDYFPETLRWEPQLITDEQGHTSIDLELADSITTWRLSASAVTVDGRLGATQKPLKVFQPFFVDLNLPVALTRGDEVTVPVVVYNYLDKPQTVVLTLSAGDWFTGPDDAEKRIELAPGQVLATGYRLRVEKVGDHALTVTARGGDVTDAIKRQIEVVPNGRRFEEVASGSLQEPVSVTLDVPKNTVEGSAKAIVKIYPSSFSQLVEGLDGIFQMPSGCFEQTSSTTYPNILALDYLRKTKQNQPEVEQKAERYIHLGYQRLLSFEVPGGGFDWFGHAPANRTLTAYGLMEFEDMARVYPIDPDLILRTRAWLLKQRNKDGSWTPEGHVPHDTVEMSGDEAQATVAATAYIAGAVFADPKTTDAGGHTRSFLLSFAPEEIKNPHTLALVCNALQRLDPAAVKKYLDRLESLKTTANQGQFASWVQPKDARTTFYGAGRSADVETTALAALALQGDTGYRATANAALAWLVTQKDTRGTWHTTQATVLSLKALLAGMNPGGNDKERRVEVRLDGQVVEQVVIPANRSEVMAQLDLSKHLKAGRHQLTLKETTATAAGYQVAFRYHLDAAAKADNTDLFGVDLAYERTELTVGDVMTVKARVHNRMEATAAMVMVELPVPAGFVAVLDDFDGLQEKQVVAKYQVLPQAVLLYLRDLPAGKPLEMTYRLRATVPVNVTAAGARVYEYYDPDRQGRSPVVRLTVKAAP